MTNFSLQGATYLIAAELSFLPTRQTKNIELKICDCTSFLTTRSFTSKEDKLSLDPIENKLLWIKGNMVHSVISLVIKEQYEIVRWIEIHAIEAGIKPPFSIGNKGKKPSSTNEKISYGSFARRIA